MRLKVEIVVEVDVDDEEYDIENVSRTLVSNGTEGLNDGRGYQVKSLVATYARRQVFEGE